MTREDLEAGRKLVDESEAMALDVVKHMPLLELVRLSEALEASTAKMLDELRHDPFDPNANRKAGVILINKVAINFLDCELLRRAEERMTAEEAAAASE